MGIDDDRGALFARHLNSSQFSDTTDVYKETNKMMLKLADVLCVTLKLITNDKVTIVFYKKKKKKTLTDI